MGLPVVFFHLFIYFIFVSDTKNDNESCLVTKKEVSLKKLVNSNFNRHEN